MPIQRSMTDSPYPDAIPGTSSPMWGDEDEYIDAPELTGNPVAIPGFPERAEVVDFAPKSANAGIEFISAPELSGADPTPATHAPVATNDTVYKRAGMLTANQVINGRADQYAHLDATIVEVKAHVQSQLVSLGKDEEIDQARRNPEIRQEISAEIDRVALNYMLRERKVRGTDGEIVVASVINDILGLGPLEPLWQDSSITEVIVNGPNDVYVEQKGVLVKAKACRFRSQEHLLDVCQRILVPLNRKVDMKDPLADGRLPDWSRVNVVHQAVAPKGPLLTIRRFPEHTRSLVDLVSQDSLDQDMAVLLATLVANRTSILICGGTGSGKTTFLNALSEAISPKDRIITIEDSLELRLNPANHVAAMEARPPDASGGNSVTIRSLVKNALRMKPTRIIVGEIRDSAALDMLQACNTGHEGSMSTIHANGPDEAISRLAVMVAQGGEMPSDKVEWLVGSAIDLIVMVRQYADGSRRVSGLYEVPNTSQLSAGVPLRTIPLWEWEQTGVEADGKIVGVYTKKADISESLVKSKGLEYGVKYTWDDLLNLSAGDGSTKPAAETEAPKRTAKPGRPGNPAAAPRRPSVFGQGGEA